MGIEERESRRKTESTDRSNARTEPVSDMYAAFMSHAKSPSGRDLILTCDVSDAAHVAYVIVIDTGFLLRARAHLARYVMSCWGWLCKLLTDEIRSDRTQRLAYGMKRIQDSGPQRDNNPSCPSINPDNQTRETRRDSHGIGVNIRTKRDQ